jgi:hypothetical protein
MNLERGPGRVPGRCAHPAHSLPLAFERASRSRLFKRLVAATLLSRSTAHVSHKDDLNAPETLIRLSALHGCRPTEYHTRTALRVKRQRHHH